jgi:hypothetical protein
MYGGVKGIVANCTLRRKSAFAALSPDYGISASPKRVSRSDVGFRCTAVAPKDWKQSFTALQSGQSNATLTLEATGTQHAARSGNLLLCVRVGRKVGRREF